MGKILEVNRKDFIQPGALREKRIGNEPVREVPTPCTPVVQAPTTRSSIARRKLETQQCFRHLHATPASAANR